MARLAHLVAAAVALTAGLGLSAFTTAPAASAAADSQQRPNVIIILADDLGAGDVTALNGRNYFRTPNIDRLAREGVAFTQAYVTGAVCSPSRAGLHTGRYQARFGQDFNPRQRETPEFSLPQDQPTIAEGMQKAGYRTGLIGKWHLGRNVGYDPISRGFDEYFGYGSGAFFISDPKPGDVMLPLGGPGARRGRDRGFIRGRTPVEETGYLTEVVTREAVSFIERAKDRPFYLVVAHHAPHVPIETTKAYMDRVLHIEGQERQAYAGMVTAVDDGVGAILDKLRATGLEKRTIVVFLSDNGCPDYIEQLCSNGQTAGHKRDFREGGIRTPLLMRWPGVARAGQRYDKPVISLDLGATALAAAGAQKSLGALDGRDLAPFLKGAPGAPHDRLYWRAGPMHAVREGDWKLLTMPKVGGGTATFLFNLADDRSETTDLSGSRGDVVTRLQAAYGAWDSQNRPPRWEPRTVTKDIAGQTVELKF